MVPTRERHETLHFALQTCLAQDFTDYEIVVCDNFSSPETHQVVECFGSPRIRYVRAPRPLAMSANWELAVTEARGRYVTVLGDDDGLLPFALRELALLITEHDSPPAVRWSRAIYTWPTISIPEDANYLCVPLARSKTLMDARATVARVIEFEVGPDALPMIYSSVIRRDLIDELRNRVGSVFPTIYPDIWSGFALGTLAGTYLSLDVPMSIAGLGGRSNGVATMLVPEGDAVATEFTRLNAEFGIRPHPRVPDLPLPPIHVVDSFEHAQDLLFPDEPIRYDRTAMALRYLESIPVGAGPVRERYRAAIGESLADVPETQHWFDTSAPDPAPAPWFRLRPARLGYDGYALHTDTSAVGVLDVAAACRFTAGLLGVGPGPIAWNIPPVSAMAAQIRDLKRRVAVAEASALKASRDHAALRRKYRRLQATHRELGGRRADRKGMNSGTLPPSLRSLRRLLGSLVGRVRR